MAETTKNKETVQRELGSFPPEIEAKLREKGVKTFYKDAKKGEPISITVGKGSIVASDDAKQGKSEESSAPIFHRDTSEPEETPEKIIDTSDPDLARPDGETYYNHPTGQPVEEILFNDGSSQYISREAWRNSKMLANTPNMLKGKDEIDYLDFEAIQSDEDNPAEEITDQVHEDGLKSSFHRGLIAIPSGIAALGEGMGETFVAVASSIYPDLKEGFDKEAARLAKLRDWMDEKGIIEKDFEGLGYWSLLAGATQYMTGYAGAYGAFTKFFKVTKKSGMLMLISRLIAGEGGVGVVHKSEELGMIQSFKDWIEDAFNLDALPSESMAKALWEYISSADPDDSVLERKFKVAIGDGSLFVVLGAVGHVGLRQLRQWAKKNPKEAEVLRKKMIKIKAKAFAGVANMIFGAKGLYQSIKKGRYAEVSAKGQKFILPFVGAGGVVLSAEDAEARGWIKGVFTSGLARAVKEIPEKGTGKQILGQIRNIPGVKETEIKWMELDDFLMNKEFVTKQEVLDWVKANRIEVRETQFPKKISTEDRELSKRIKAVWKRRTEYEEAPHTWYDYDNIHYESTYRRSALDDSTIPQSKAELRQSLGRFQEQAHGSLIESFRDVDTKMLDVDGIIKKYKKAGKDAVEFIRVKKQVSGGLRPSSELEFMSRAEWKSKVKAAKTDFRTNYKVDSIITLSKSELIKYSIESDSRMLGALSQEKTGAARFEKQWTESGGTEYTELIFSIKWGKGDIPVIPVELGRFSKTQGIPELPPRLFGMKLLKDKTERGTVEFSMRRHMDVPGEIAHVRFKTRIDSKGRKILAVEEMQQDFRGTAQLTSELDPAKLGIGEIPGIPGHPHRARLNDPLKDQEGKLLTHDVGLGARAKDGRWIVDFPLKNTWYEMTIRRLVRYAADNDFDAISVPKASIIQKRYKLTSKINSFEIYSFDLEKKTVQFRATDIEDRTQVWVDINDIWSFDRVEKEFSKEVLDKIVAEGKLTVAKNRRAAARPTTAYRPEDYGKSNTKLPFYDDGTGRSHTIHYEIKLPKTLAVNYGGKGKEQLYNKAIPSYMKKFAKKWDAKVYDDFILKRPQLGDYWDEKRAGARIPVTVLEVTPAMKKAAKESGVDIFNILTPTLAGAGTEMLSGKEAEANPMQIDRIIDAYPAEPPERSLQDQLGLSQERGAESGD